MTRNERAVLYVLHEAQKEFGDRRVPTVTLYGRVCELVDISVNEFQTIVARMAGPSK